MYKTIADGKPWHDEIRNKRKDGGYYWVDTTIVPILDDLNKPQSYISIRTDITDRILMQSELEEYSNDLEQQVSQRTKELLIAKENAESANEEKSPYAN